MTEQIAIKGWGIAELARRAKVGRPTIYAWRDTSDGSKLQSAPVNAVADVLGIPRERALRLAGIIPRREPEQQEAPPAPEPDPVPANVLEALRNAVARGERTPEWEAAAVEALEAIARERLQRPEKEESSSAAEPSSERRAG